MEGLVRGLHVLGVASPLQEVGRSGLYQLHPVHCFLIRHQMPAVTVIHPGSDKHMIPCGLILWEEGWNFLWVRMPQEKGHFLSLECSPGCPRLVMDGTTISRLCKISLVFASHFHCFIVSISLLIAKGTLWIWTVVEIIPTYEILGFILSLIY